MKEVWKPIIGYEKYYEVSNLGRVKSLFKGKEVVRIKKILKRKKKKQSEIAKMFDVSKACISAIRTGRNYKHVEVD